MNGVKLKIQNKAEQCVGGRLERGGRAAIEERARCEPGAGAEGAAGGW